MPQKCWVQYLDYTYFQMMMINWWSDFNPLIICSFAWTSKHTERYSKDWMHFTILRCDMYNWHAPPKLNNTFYVYCVVAMLGRWQCLLNCPYFIHVVPVSWPHTVLLIFMMEEREFQNSCESKKRLSYWNFKCKLR